MENSLHETEQGTIDANEQNDDDVTAVQDDVRDLSSRGESSGDEGETDDTDIHVVDFNIPRSFSKTCVTVCSNTLELLLRIEVAKSNEELLRNIASNVANTCDLIFANCEQGNTALTLLLEHGADPNEKFKGRCDRTWSCSEWYTPLLVAIECENCSAIEILCGSGASFEVIASDRRLSSFFRSQARKNFRMKC